VKGYRPIPDVRSEMGNCKNEEQNHKDNDTAQNNNDVQNK
jgi:hypothetical protein